MCPPHARLYSSVFSLLQKPANVRVTMMWCTTMYDVVQVYQDGESDPDLMREPEKENTGGKRTYYHSVQVCIADGLC